MIFTGRFGLDEILSNRKDLKYCFLENTNKRSKKYARKMKTFFTYKLKKRTFLIRHLEL